MTKREIRIAVLTCLLGSLTACGGGGKGGGGIGGISLGARAISPTRIALSWTPPENGSVNPYVVARNDANSDARVGSTSSLTYQVASLEPATQYCFVIRNPLLGYAMSNTACATTPLDTTPPGTPRGLTVTIISPAEVDLQWDFSGDDDRVAGYNVFRDGTLIETTPAVALSAAPAIPGTTHCFSVSAFDPSGNESPAGPDVCTTMPADNENPTIPTDVAAVYSDDGQSQVTVTWTAATDNGRVVLYEIYLNGDHVADATTEAYEDLAPVPNSNLCYTINAIDAAGNESGQSDPACARRGWKSTTIEPGTNFTTDIAVDRNDMPHIAYKKRLTSPSSTADYSLDYVVLQPDQPPAPQQLETTMETFWFNDAQTVAITVDNSSAAHIVHKVSRGDRMLPEDVRHVQPSLTPVGIDIIEQTDQPLYTVSLTTDMLGVVHACYTLSNQIIYANNAGGVWTLTDMATLVAGVEGWDCSIAIDSNGAIHMSYLEVLTFDPSMFDLMYLTNASGGWTQDRLDAGTSEVSAGFSTSIAVDGNDNVHIAYFHDYNTYDLEYATNASGAWASMTIDSQGNVGRYCDIAVDADGFVHIVYQDYTNDTRLEKYATNRSGGWETAILADADVGNTALAIDSLGNIHVVYTGKDGLTYLTNRPE